MATVSLDRVLVHVEATRTVITRALVLSMVTGAGVLATACIACSDDGGTDGVNPAAQSVYFDLEATYTSAVGDRPGAFWNLPFPSDLRLAATGEPDLSKFPNPREVALLDSFLESIRARRGFPVMPAAYFRFTDAFPEHDVAAVIPAAATSPVLLLDVDPESPERGTLYPVVATTLPYDAYTAEHLLGLAPRPGIVLRASTRYAYVVQKSFAPGFEVPAQFAALAAGATPVGAHGAAAAALYAPLWPALTAAGVAATDVLVATVFTTGDEVARTRARSEAVRAQFHPTLDGLALVGGDTYDGFCRLTGTITMPQFQVGTPPFATEGHFVLDASDVPQAQGMLAIPVTLTLPKSAMPANGWPLYQFFHGSGGRSTGLVDLGRAPTSADMPEPGKGPGWVVAHYGIAAASAALPVNPERLPGASDYEYLNLENLDAFPYTFQQGVIEQRLLTDALLAVQIPAATLSGCSLPAPPGGLFHFDGTKLVAGGQSMGGMYTNMTGAVEPRYGALVPTGAGGFWNYMILNATVVPGAKELVSGSLGVDASTVTFVHPAMHAIEMGWEIADPLVYMARIAHRPLPGLPARHVYEPVPKGDENFPIEIYDAAALSYGNQQAGAAVWPSMQDALGEAGLDGIATYPVKANVDGKTRVVVQYEGDGIVDPHYIYRQLEAVKFQYACFFASYLRDGVPTVPAPGTVGDPCP